ncbi:hypothetical protein [Natronospora cellulosivora (SeqCode)]
MRGGVLLLSYPSIESYCISNFYINSCDLAFSLGTETKAFLVANNHMQINNINDGTIKEAVNELKRYLEREKIDFDVDNFARANMDIFNRQEHYYLRNSKYRLLSLLSVAFIQLGIISNW